MTDLCDYLLVWFMRMYNEGEVPMSPEVYDRAVFVVGVGVPMLLYTALLIVIIGAGWAMFDVARGKRR